MSFVICDKAETCVRHKEEIEKGFGCGGATPHPPSDCEICPIDTNAECIECKTSAEWQEQIKDFCVITDHDGWRNRGDEGLWINTPITKENFVNRLNVSTIKLIGIDASLRLEHFTNS